jgi:hypothetical protein
VRWESDMCIADHMKVKCQCCKKLLQIQWDIYTVECCVVHNGKLLLHSISLYSREDTEICRRDQKPL